MTTTTIRGVLCDVLQIGGYRVEVAYDRERALAVFSTRYPDAILLDVMTPVMDGRAFLKGCRTDPECGGTPVLIMSAHPKPKDTAGEFHVSYLQSRLLWPVFSVRSGD
jgi:CheY-like chemotaxis protein